MQRTLLLAALAAACMAPLAGADPPARERRVDAIDVLNLRELGSGRTGPALSPDRTRLAVMERATLIEADAYHYDLLVLEARAGARPQIVGDGGGFILDSDNGRRSGASVARTPLWSPDGRWIAYLAEREGRAELWLSSLDGQVRRALAGEDADVQRFAWMEDSQALVVVTLTPRAVLAERLREAVRDGFRADDRFDPGYSLMPPPDEDGGRQTFVVGLDGVRRNATDSERVLLSAAPRRDAGARVAPIDAENRAAQPERHVLWEDADGVVHACMLVECRGDILAAWANEDGSEIYFQKEEGPARDLNVFYAWRVGEPGVVRLIRRAEERMMSCEWASGRLFCMQEFATQPRRIVALDVTTGALDLVYDPNPHWREFALPRVERIDLSAERYEASYAHLVYPNRYRAGRRYPLIVVQYRSRGFLRWGTGAQMPIFAAAARGYFVLSLERPQPRALERLMSYNELGTSTELDGSERAMKLDQLDRLIAVLAERGLIDPERVALTGMSDGAETLYAALSRGVSYGAASVGSQPTDALNWHLTSERFRDVLRNERGLSGPWPDAPDPWASWWRDNIVLNRADRISTPLMFHLSESEALYAAPLIVRLHEAGLPTESYIYPGAYHLKWRPRQILSMQERSLAWFDFWLRQDERRIDAGDAARWRALRGSSPPAE